MTIEEIFGYCRDNYGTEPEYPWDTLPQACVLRHRDNAKWYGILMDVDHTKVGGKTHEPVPVLNIKGNPDDIIHLREMEGFAPAYHMNKKHWLSVVLPDVPDAQVVFRLLDKSYDLTAPKQRKRRPQP